MSSFRQKEESGGSAPVGIEQRRRGNPRATTVIRSWGRGWVGTRGGRLPYLKRERYVMRGGNLASQNTHTKKVRYPFGIKIKEIG